MFWYILRNFGLDRGMEFEEILFIDFCFLGDVVFLILYLREFLKLKFIFLFGDLILVFNVFVFCFDIFI